jgi:hypothetical protein
MSLSEENQKRPAHAGLFWFKKNMMRVDQWPRRRNIGLHTTVESRVESVSLLR